MGDAITGILQEYSPITLGQMDKVCLMNRVDTKFVTTFFPLLKILEKVRDEYKVLEIDGLRNMPYSTCYYDTPDCSMFFEHQRGRMSRQKIRLRRYENTATEYLEIKSKNNHGRTGKTRMLASEGYEIEKYAEFIREHSFYAPETLVPQLQNRFSRMTLVNKGLTERLTIDTDLRYHNLPTRCESSLEGLVIVELKRDARTQSPVLNTLRELHIHPSGFSKYCIGMALTNGLLKQNRFKPKLRMLRRMLSDENTLSAAKAEYA